MHMFVLLLCFLSYIVFSNAIPIVDDENSFDKYYDDVDDTGNSYNKITVKEKNEKLPCNKCVETKNSGFTVILLSEASHRFLGMGGILDSKTVLTSGNVVRAASGQADQILALGGYSSPWWGKTSAVRRGNQVLTNEFEIALIETTPPWRFNDRIYPIDIAQSKSVPDGTRLMVYGLTGSGNYKSGRAVPEKLSYDTVVHTVDKRGKCGKEYPDLKPPFNETFHFCLHPNGSFCTGAVGSMAVALGKRNVAKEIMGIVVRSSCELKKRQLVVVKASTVFNWIKFNSFLV